MAREPLLPRLLPGFSRRALPVPHLLDRRHVYILPTRAGYAFAGTLLLMLLGSVNYNLGLGYVLTFLLAGLGNVALLHTWRNLAGLSVRPLAGEPAVAGEPVAVCLGLTATTRLAHRSVGLKVPRGTVRHVDVDPGAEVAACVPLPPARRGWLAPGRLDVETTYPLGLFRAWSPVRFDWRVLVLPRPEAGAPPVPVAPGDGEGDDPAAGDDDLAGLRDYRPGDPLKRVSWKTLARRGTPATKEFAGGLGGQTRRVDWELCPSGMDTEARLSRLAAWVLEAHGLGVPWSLHLPGTELPVASGAAHRDRSLEALALFPA